MRKKITLTPEQFALANKPRYRSTTDDSIANMLRYCRPMRAALAVVVKEHEVEVEECEVPDLASLDGVIDEGFDPDGPCGPTYWRITASHYYSTMLTKKGVVLSIAKLTR